jgi:GNAT superfamily N-acetyltransferase
LTATGDQLGHTLARSSAEPAAPRQIAKMMTRVSHRHRGIATALLREAERMATARGRWLLVLDTAEDEGAAGLYERMGFKLPASFRIRFQAAAVRR